MEELKKYNEARNNGQETKNNSKIVITILIIIISILTVLVLILGISYLNEKDSNSKNTKETKEENNENEEDIIVDEEEVDNEEESDTEEVYKEIAFDERDANEKLNTYFSELLNLFEYEEDNDYLDSGFERILYLLLNYDGEIYDDEETTGVYTSVDSLKAAYKKFYGSLYNFDSDVPNDLVHIYGDKASLCTMFGESIASWKFSVSKLVYYEKQDLYVLSGTGIQTNKEALNYNKERDFVLEYKKENNSNYLVGFTVTKLK